MSLKPLPPKAQLGPRCFASTWDASETNRRAKYYALTKAGRRQLGDETAQWNRIALAMARALEA